MARKTLSQPEFIGLMAIVMAISAFSTDMMLPAFPQMAAELTPHAPERTALIVSVFMVGMGVGTFFTGPLSDAFGRKAVITGGIGLYAIGSVLSGLAPDFPMLLAGRALQGLGAAAPRVVAPAMIRDLYEGRKMAQMTSFIMAVFMFVPAMAPWLGQFVIAAAGWREIFGTFVFVGAVAALWLNTRQAETLPRAARRPLHPGVIVAGIREVVSHREVLIYTLILTLGFSQLIALISTVQPIYDVILGVPEWFAFLFMSGALLSAVGTILNASLVMRLGMRRLVRAAFGLQVVLSLLYLPALELAHPSGWLAVAMFFSWSALTLFMNGMTFGNLNAMALQPLGHLAGLAASVITGLSTVGAALIAGVVGLVATPTVLAAQVVVCSGLALALMWRDPPQGK